MSSKWEQFGIEEKIIQILKTVQTNVPEHHFRLPYLSSYQLAIEFDQRHPDVRSALGYKLGGIGNEDHFSFTQYLARELSRRIHLKLLPQIEGALLSDQHMKCMTFHNGDEEIHSSLAGFGMALSMFRYVEQEGL